MTDETSAVKKPTAGGADVGEGMSVYSGVVYSTTTLPDRPVIGLYRHATESQLEDQCVVDYEIRGTYIMSCCSCRSMLSGSGKLLTSRVSRTLPSAGIAAVYDS